MKRLFVLPIILFLLVGCQNKETLAELSDLKAKTELEEHNKALIEKYIEAWNTKDIQIITEFLDPGFMIFIPSNSQEPMSLVQYKGWFQNMLQNFPDIHYHIQDMVVDGDRIGVRWDCHASLKGTDPDGAESAKQILGSAIEIYKVLNGKIMEERSEMDALGWNQQMGYSLIMEDKE